MISWLGFLLSMTGQVLLYRKSRAAFIWWNFSNLIWIVISFNRKDYAQLSMFIVYFIANLNTYLKWGRDEKDGAIKLFISEIQKRNLDNFLKEVGVDVPAWQLTREQYEELYTVRKVFDCEMAIKEYIRENAVEKSTYGVWFYDKNGVKWFVDDALKNYYGCRNFKPSYSISSLNVNVGKEIPYHKDIVADAIQNGEKIPESVLSLYPDLVSTAAMSVL